MFSKSKRFPEGGKEYIPGPGEYQVNLDDTGRHKRYGFLNQTNRFQEDQQHVFDSTSSNEFYEHQYQSSTTTSTTSKASDDNNRNIKKSLTLMQVDSQQLMAMQKEIDILQAKAKKQSATIQSLEQEKCDTKAILISKDLELGEQRAKNATLQKTIQRQEVSTKAAQLQKKIDQLESVIESLNVSHQQELESKENTIQEHVSKIAHLVQTQQELKSVEAHLLAQLAAAETNAKEQEAQLKHEIQCMTNQLETHQDLLIASEKQLELKTQRVDDLLIQNNEKQCAIQDAEALITHLRQRFATYNQWVDGTVVPHLRHMYKKAQEHQVTELRHVQQELVEAKKFINRQAQHLAGLKSDVHWLTVQNNQVSLLLTTMSREHKEQWVWNKHWYDGKQIPTLPTSPTSSTTSSLSSPHRKSSAANSKHPGRQQQQHQQRRPLRSGRVVKQVIDEDDYSSDSVSFTSRSTSSNDDEVQQNETIMNSSIIALNDSGFGILADEIK